MLQGKLATGELAHQSSYGLTHFLRGLDLGVTLGDAIWRRFIGSSQKAHRPRGSSMARAAAVLKPEPCQAWNGHRSVSRPWGALHWEFMRRNRSARTRMTCRAKSGVSCTR